MVDCSFCGVEIERGTGKTIVKKDNSIIHVCSMKCEKNMLVLKRNALKVPWTKKAQTFKAKKLAAVSTKESKGSKTEKNN